MIIMLLFIVILIKYLKLIAGFTCCLAYLLDFWSWFAVYGEFFSWI